MCCGYSESWAPYCYILEHTPDAASHSLHACSPARPSLVAPRLEGSARQSVHPLCGELCAGIGNRSSTGQADQDPPAAELMGMPALSFINLGFIALELRLRRDAAGAGGPGNPCREENELRLLAQANP